MFLTEFSMFQMFPFFGISAIYLLIYALGIIMFIFNVAMIIVNPKKIKQFFHAESYNDVDYQYISRKMKWAGFGLFTLLLAILLNVLAFFLLLGLF
jgi:hypothetical protein